MNILNCYVRIVRANIIVAEIPESLDAERNKLVYDFFCVLARNTENSNNRGVVLAEIIKSVNVAYRNVAYQLTRERLVLIKNTDKIETALFKRHVRGNCLAEMSRADSSNVYLLHEAC